MQQNGVVGQQDDLVIGPQDVGVEPEEQVARPVEEPVTRLPLRMPQSRGTVGVVARPGNGPALGVTLEPALSMS